ncbi:Nn.00g021070.m01.CDS01 [Neocucurbitaria sp. VM-36]
MKDTNGLLQCTTALLHVALALTSPSLFQHNQRLQCSRISLSSTSEFRMLSTEAAEVHNFSAPATSSTPAVSNLSFCNVSLVLSHTEDVVYAWVWLPLEDWNGRFLVAGGGGLVAGAESTLAQHVVRGFAAGSTDAGLSPNITIANSGAWAIKSPGVLNVELIENFAHRSIHDVATIGKAVVKAFYGVRPRYLYYSGCSTGGRQGYHAAQWYPKDFHGILANAPALYQPRISPGIFWPPVVMRNIAAPPMCVFQAYQEAAISACDGHDGVVDGVISKPETCKLDPKQLIGSKIACVDTEGDVTISAVYADVIAKIVQGPRDSSGAWLWYGLPPGAPFNVIANTSTNGSSTVPVPFSVAEAWVRYLIYQDSNYNTANMTFDDYFKAYQRSVELFTTVIGTDHPNLSRFRKAGGKLLTWHGLADPIIAPEGSIRYRRALERRSGGPKKTNRYHRLFLAPGVEHCRGGAGPVPTDPLAALMDWVEKGKAPIKLLANTTGNGTVIERKLCPYPRIQTYIEGKNPNITESFFCS